MLWTLTTYFCTVRYVLSRDLCMSVFCWRQFLCLQPTTRLSGYMIKKTRKVTVWVWYQSNVNVYNFIFIETLRCIKYTSVNHLPNLVSFHWISGILHTNQNNYRLSRNRDLRWPYPNSHPYQPYGYLHVVCFNDPMPRVIA